jgi:hypothetical protein
VVPEGTRDCIGHRLTFCHHFRWDVVLGITPSAAGEVFKYGDSQVRSSQQ